LIHAARFGSRVPGFYAATILISALWARIEFGMHVDVDSRLHTHCEDIIHHHHHHHHHHLKMAVKVIGVCGLADW
jgi:hypothetical protein